MRASGGVVLSMDTKILEGIWEGQGREDEGKGERKRKKEKGRMICLNNTYSICFS